MLGGSCHSTDGSRDGNRVAKESNKELTVLCVSHHSSDYGEILLVGGPSDIAGAEHSAREPAEGYAKQHQISGLGARRMLPILYELDTHPIRSVAYCDGIGVFDYQ